MLDNGVIYIAPGPYYLYKSAIDFTRFTNVTTGGDDFNLKLEPHKVYQWEFKQTQINVSPLAWAWSPPTVDAELRALADRIDTLTLTLMTIGLPMTDPQVTAIRATLLRVRADFNALCAIVGFIGSP